MSILIKNMEMPKSCANCYFKYVAFEGLVKCDLAGHDFKDYRQTGYRDDCPLIEIPPHGRLIDADVLRQEWVDNRKTMYIYDANDFLFSVDDAPTIIEAEVEK